MPKSKSKTRKPRSKYGNKVLDAAGEVGEFAANVFIKHKLSGQEGVIAIGMVARGLIDAIKERAMEADHNSHAE